jgi:hypothetical protein
MVDWLVGLSIAALHRLAALATKRVLDLETVDMPACGSHHRQMVDWLVGRSTVPPPPPGGVGYEESVGPRDSRHARLR